MGVLDYWVCPYRMSGLGVLNYCLNFPGICAFYHKSAQILR